MDEDYMHSDSNLIYMDESIPGPVEDSAEYDYIVSNFNSLLTNHCSCEPECNLETCNCLIKSGQTHYERFEGVFRLRTDVFKNIGNSLSYPIIECNSLCKCSEYCGNRLVQKGPIKGLVVKNCVNMFKNKGLFTTQFIPRGTFIIEYAGEIITSNEARMRHSYNQRHGLMNYIFCLNEYCDEIHLQMIVDPSKFGNLGRYINHSCEPNCVIIPVRVESPLPKLAIFSQTDIPSYSEITYDYGSNSFCKQAKVENRKECLCESTNCKGLMPFDQY